MDKDWLVFDQHPSKPKFAVPVGAVDAHCHVFGPVAEFPFAPERKYTPCDASKGQLFALRDFLGFSRNIIVQATCHGKDNRALLDALAASEGMARGVATIGSEITEPELERMDASGVKAVRFNFVKRLVDSTSPDELMAVADKIKNFGWHVVVYLEAQDLAELTPFLKQLPTTVVFDHMGRPDVAKGVNHPDFLRFVDLMQNEKFWTKVTCPERLSVTGPPDYDDVAPFGRLLVERYPNRVLWGTDWPHPNMKSHMPDDGTLVDFIPKIAPDEAAQVRLLVDNPMRLYWN